MPEKTSRGERLVDELVIAARLEGAMTKLYSARVELLTYIACLETKLRIAEANCGHPITLPTFAIFDSGHGLLQWLGTAATADAAIRAYHTQAQFDEHRLDDLLVAQVAADEVVNLHARPLDITRVSAGYVAALLGFTDC